MLIPLQSLPCSNGVFLVQPSVDGFVSLLHTFFKKGERLSVFHLHGQICRSGLESHKLLGNCLVFVLAELGSLRDAQQVFDRLLFRNKRSWSALIQGYLRCERLQDALALYGEMQRVGTIHPCDRSFVALLKACSNFKEMESGYEVHGEVCRLGLLEKNMIIGSTLVDMYGKYGLLCKAQQVFDSLSARNVVTWTALITGYAEHGCSKEALRHFELMRVEGVSPNVISFLCILTACSDIWDTLKGQEIHLEIELRGFLEDVVVGNAVVDMYAQCGLLEAAQCMFDKLPSRDIIAWTILISGYVEYGLGEEALKKFETMQLEGICADAILFVCILKACGSIRAIEKGKEIHDQVKSQGLLEGNLFVGNMLVDMYAKCGLLYNAQEVFDKLQVRNVVSWSSLIAGYSEHGYGKEVLKLFDQMQKEQVLPEASALVCSLKACGSLKALKKGEELHAEIERQGLLEKDISIGNSLIDMYGKCGAVCRAEEVFASVLVRDLVTWNTLIAGFAEHGHGEVALKYLEQMRAEGLFPDSVTYIYSLKACSTIGAPDNGRELHCEAARRGLLEKDICLGNVLVDMYAKCGLLFTALEVFDKILVRNAASWNALITAHMEHGHAHEALTCLDMMLLEGTLPDAVTFVCSLSACGITGALDKGIELHVEIERRGLMGKDYVGNSLVDMYFKCGIPATAQEVFDQFLFKDVISWNVLITGYSDYGCIEDALDCFNEMQAMGVSPNATSLLCSLRASMEVGAMGKAEELHAEIERQGLLDREFAIGNILVNLYANRGLLAFAQEVFDRLPVQTLVAETALMAGYSQLGESREVFHIFERILQEGVRPDPTAFTVILNACSRAGQFSKSQTYFEAMSNDYGIVPTIEHHGCMVNLLGRTGELTQAFAMAEKLCLVPNSVLWQLLLNACSNWGNMELGRVAFGRSVA